MVLKKAIVDKIFKDYCELRIFHQYDPVYFSLLKRFFMWHIKINMAKTHSIILLKNEKL